MNEIISTSGNTSANIVANPFGAATNLNTNIGATEAASRELAEMQAGIFLAKQFPRDQRQATENILTACQRPGLASVAVYSYARGGTNIAGPSIRLAEELARNWGNLDCGWNEIEREYDKSKLEAWAWDKQTNVKKMIHFYVPHYRTTRLERKRITDERDLYELLANQAARRMRNCILALIPGDIIDAAVDQCQRTMVTHVDISPESIRKLVDAFAQFEVTKTQIEKRIQRRIDAITPAQFVRMREIYTSLNDGMSEPADWFDPEDDGADAKKASPKATATTESLKSVIRGANLIGDAPAPTADANTQSNTPPKEEQPAKGGAKNTKSEPAAEKEQQQPSTTASKRGNSAANKTAQIIDAYRMRIVAAKTRDEFVKITDELIKRDDLPDKDRDELYHMIDDLSSRLS